MSVVRIFVLEDEDDGTLRIEIDRKNGDGVFVTEEVSGIDLQVKDITSLEVIDKTELTWL